MGGQQEEALFLCLVGVPIGDSPVTAYLVLLFGRARSAIGYLLGVGCWLLAIGGRSFPTWLAAEVIGSTADMMLMAGRDVAGGHGHPPTVLHPSPHLRRTGALQQARRPHMLAACFGFCGLGIASGPPAGRHRASAEST